MRNLDFYEFVGILLPGVVLLTVAGLAFPEAKADLVGQDLSFGDFGLATLIAYVLGHLIQGIGNGLEALWWKVWGGMPTDWVRSGKHRLISDEQGCLLESGLRKVLRNESFDLKQGMDSDEWYSITRQVYAFVSARGHAQRVDVFNGNYGLCRGVAAAMLVSLVIVCAKDWTAWRAELLLLGLAALAVYRMHRFGVRYGRELFVQFIHASTRAEEAK